MPCHDDLLWEKGWLFPANKKYSSNFSPRSDEKVSLIVIHNISLPPFEYGQGMPHDLFLNQLEKYQDPFLQSIVNLRVSSHFLIERNGVMTQFVSCDDIAFHAGASFFKGRSKCNQFSIGIELEGCDFEPFTEKQYQTLFSLLKEICKEYPIQSICGHSHIAPDRKTDPGHFFDWNRLIIEGLPVDIDFI